MSYEGKMLIEFKMPTRKEVEEALLITLFNYKGIIKEFATGEEIVNEIANQFSLNKNQRSAVLERMYHKEKRIVKTPLWHRLLYRAKQTMIRARGFRQAVTEAYGYKCAFCGLKINSLKDRSWEVEAAYIVPHNKKGRDDILNGLSFCHLHHWAFDAGWLTLQDNLKTQISPKITPLHAGFGIMGNYDFIRAFSDNNSKIFLPKRKEIYPMRKQLFGIEKKSFVIK